MTITKEIKDYTDEELKTVINHPKYTELFACTEEFNRRAIAVPEEAPIDSGKKVSKVKHKYIVHSYGFKSIACIFRTSSGGSRLGCALEGVDATYANLRELVRQKHTAIRKASQW